MEKFRKLRADEIECRVSQISEKGLALLLYKDARCDMRLLDEVVGPENWQCRYEEHKGTLFCYVGIRAGKEWIWKSDAGAPSNMESQKGEASDAFKRACFRWNIGRELYTAPFIWIPAGNYSASQKNGKWTTYDKFRVTAIGYDSEGNIDQLKIVNQKTRRGVFELGGHSSTPEPVEARETANTASEGHISEKQWKVLQGICKEKGKDPLEILLRYGYGRPSEVPLETYDDMIRALGEDEL